jgi:phage FluMu gp28-like protein
MDGIDIQNLTKKDLLKLEYLQCITDPTFPIETYLETFDQTQGGFVPFKLFRRQKNLIYSYNDERLNLVKKYRQAGITTITAAYSSVITTFAPKESPQKVLIIANKLTTAMEFLRKIVDFIGQYPDRLHLEKGIDKNGNITPFKKKTEKHVILYNKSEIKAVATSPDALRGYTPTLMILDEAAFIEGGENMWAACLASLSTGGKATLISTPNGHDSIYYTTYDEAILNKNNFIITDIKWWEDPRFNKSLRMVQTDDIISASETLVGCTDKKTAYEYAKFLLNCN